jgi:hypothetical protein
VPRNSTEIVNEIRKLITINFLDPNAVRIVIGTGRVVITGEIQRLPGYDSPVLARTLTKLEVDLTNIREVKFIRWNLENWSNEAGQWRQVKQRKREF